MEAYLRSLLLWEAIKSSIETKLLENPTLNQIKLYEERVSRKYKALSSLQATVNEATFTRIMAYKVVKEV